MIKRSLKLICLLLSALILIPCLIACGGGNGADTTVGDNGTKAPDTTDAPKTDPPVTEPPVTEPPVTEPPVTEPPVTEPPVTEPPVTEPPVTEPPVPDTTNAQQAACSHTYAADIKNGKATYNCSICGYANPNFKTDKNGAPVLFHNTKGSASGDMLTAETAHNSLVKTAQQLANWGMGGTIVCSGPCSWGTATVPATRGTLILTSLFDGVDYRETNNATIQLTGVLQCQNDLVLEDINILTTTGEKYLSLNYFNFEARNVKYVTASGEETTNSKLSLILGATASSASTLGTGNSFNQIVYIEDGAWDRIAAGTKKGVSGTYKSDDLGKDNQGTTTIFFGPNATAKGIDLHCGENVESKIYIATEKAVAFLLSDDTLTISDNAITVFAPNKNCYKHISENELIKEYKDATSRDGKVKVLCIGDSMTQGTGTKNEPLQSYPAALNYILGYDKYEVLNCGRARATTERTDSPFFNPNGLSYTEIVQYGKALSYDADIVLIWIGTNDAKTYKTNQSAAEAEYYKALKSLVETFKSLPSQPKVYLISTHYIISYSNKDAVNGIEKVIVPQQRKLVADMDLPFIDFYSHEKENYMSIARTIFHTDFLHFNYTGYRYFADFIAKELLK